LDYLYLSAAEWIAWGDALFDYFLRWKKSVYRMSYQLTEKHGGPVAAGEIGIFIFGPRILQNQLLSFFLEQELALKCLTGNDLSNIPRINHEGETDHKGLILWDCQGKDRKELFSEFIPSVKQQLLGHHLVFFNVVSGLGIEEKGISMGVRGFFYENDPFEKLLKGVQAVLEGEVWLSRKMITRCLFQNSTQSRSTTEAKMALTPREIEILALVAVGDMNEEIADKLCISTQKVKTHLYRTFKKINVSNRLQAAFWATKNL
jgi:LuxR family transcriptional regulator of csgAB operon